MLNDGRLIVMVVAVTGASGGVENLTTYCHLSKVTTGGAKAHSGGGSNPDEVEIPIVRVVEVEGEGTLTHFCLNSHIDLIADIACSE